MPDHIDPTVGPDHEEVDQWRTTRRWAASRPSGTPSTGGPAGRGRPGELYYEELMGEEGFSSRLARCSTTATSPRPIADAREWPIGDLSTTAQPPAAAAPPQAARPVRRQGRQGDRRRHRTPPRARQRRRAHLLCRGRRAEPVVPQRDRRRVRLRRARQGPGRDGVRRLRGRRGRLRHHPAGDDAPLDPQALRPRTRCAPTASRPTATSRRRSATCQQVRPAPRARPVLRARPAPAGRARCSPRTSARGPATRPRSSSSTAATDPGGDRRHGAHAALPPARRRRLGRLPLPVRVQRRATSSRSPAASTSRRRCTRSSRAGTS